MRRSHLIVLAWSWMMIAGAERAPGATGALLRTHGLAVERFAVHPTLHVVYATVPDADAVVVISTISLNLLGTITVGDLPRGLDVAPDGLRLYVCNEGSETISVIDPFTRQVIDTLELPYAPYDIEVGLSDRLYVTPAENGPGIMQVDALTGAVQDEFELTVNVYQHGLVEISPNRQTLYFANMGLSPATLASIDVSTATASLIYKNPHGALGGSGRDLALRPNGTYICLVCGGGNDNYDIWRLSVPFFGNTGAFEVGAYPQELAWSPSGGRAYIMHDEDHIDIYNSGTTLAHIIDTSATWGGAEEMQVDRSGRYLFAAFPFALNVYDTGEGTPPTDTDGDEVADDEDNCPLDANPDQADCDEDGVGDVCAVPIEGDCNGNLVPDPCDLDDGTSDDCNVNDVPDECEPQEDGDGDAVLDPCDNCPAAANADQADTDADHVGDVCDLCSDTAVNAPVDDDGCPLETCAATRALPALCLSFGQPATVSIAVAPPDGATAFTLEERPPPGRAISDISEGGVFDAVRGIIVWFFADGDPRTLSYVAGGGGPTVPLCFTGRVSFDGEWYCVGGASCLPNQPCYFQRADRSTQLPPQCQPAGCTCSACEDFRIELCEVEALIDGWSNFTCETGLHEIVRAIYLYLRGEEYCFLSQIQNFIPREDCDTGAGVPVFQNPTGVRTMPTTYIPGVPFMVEIACQTEEIAIAAGIEERIPANWIPDQISDGGIYSPDRSGILWTFFDGEPRTLAYRLTPPPPQFAPPTSRFFGNLTTDGLGIRQITGPSTITKAADAPACVCGDLGRDGRIDLLDFLTFANCFGLPAPVAQCPEEHWTCSDLDADGTIALSDFITFSTLFGGVPDGSAPPDCPAE